MQKWEEVVKRVIKDGERWRATQHSFICSKHFETNDYIQPPTSTGSCRLKHNAVPSIFKIEVFVDNVPEEAKGRLQMPENSLRAGRKRGKLSQEEPSSVKVQINMNYEKIFKETRKSAEISKKQLKAKVRNFQQQLCRCKTKLSTMSDIINNLQENLIVKTEIANRLHTSFDKLQLSLFHNVKNNNVTFPTGRRYTDDIKEFSLTLYFYSPKAYEYVRSIIPLPNPSLIRKWSSSVDCEPGFIEESFQSLKAEVDKTPTKKDCSLVIDARPIRKQTGP